MVISAILHIINVVKMLMVTRVRRHVGHEYFCITQPFRNMSFFNISYIKLKLKFMILWHRLCYCFPNIQNQVVLQKGSFKLLFMNIFFSITIQNIRKQLWQLFTTIFFLVGSVSYNIFKDPVPILVFETLTR